MEDKTSMVYWFPKIKELGIPMPKTEIVMFLGGAGWINYLEGEELPPEPIAELKAKAKQIGYPLFMRTDILSGKHSHGRWLPYIEDERMLVGGVRGLIEASACAGVCGVPLDALVVREFLHLESKFKAFGGMPIARERRYFINNGDVVCHHPYWLEVAIRFWHNLEEPVGWKHQLKLLNTETEDEIKLLTEYAARVAKVLPEYWSVDFALAKDGTWYLIDMAEGEKSWHPDCDMKVKGA